uniref:ATP-dependent Clp protease proteolytic subunit n=1 Tax=Oryza rufipogon TaxID=4529 RepID=A0A0E0PT73_ORYRU
MALSAAAPANSSCFHPRAAAASAPSSLSVGTKVFVGLKAQTKLGERGAKKINSRIYVGFVLIVVDCLIFGVCGVGNCGAGSSESSCPNVTAGFYTAVNRRISLGLSNKRATRARISMMPVGTPRVPYRTPGEGTWQWLDIWNALYRERIIFIGDSIDEEFSNQVLASMLYLDSVDNTKKILLYINGPGGDLTPCMALYDTMLSLKSPIGTHCLGFAFNLAGFILAAGEKADDIENEANELIRIKNYLYSKLSEHTGHPVDKIHEDLSRVKRFDAEGALEYGIIDRIIRPSRIKKEGSTAQKKDLRNLGLG